MKKIALFLVLVPFIAGSNDTIQLLLESKGVSTENFKKIGATVELTGPKLIKAVNKMRTEEMLIAYITTDHESETGLDLGNKIPTLFKQNPTNDTSVIFPHYIFDGRGYNGVNSTPQNPNDDTSHNLQHQDDVIKVKKLALKKCNEAISASTPRIPVFTAPRNLVDIIYHSNRTHLTYNLHDGSTFHCIGVLSVAQ